MSKRTWKLGEKLWEEDECTTHCEGHEHGKAAWLRIFSEPLSATVDRPSYDEGDVYGFLMPNGCTYEESYDGVTIYAPEGKTKKDYP